MGEIGREIGDCPIEMISRSAVVCDMNGGKPGLNGFIGWQEEGAWIFHLYKLIYINQLLRRQFWSTVRLAILYSFIRYLVWHLQIFLVALLRFLRPWPLCHRFYSACEVETLAQFPCRCTLFLAWVFFCG